MTLSIPYKGAYRSDSLQSLLHIALDVARLPHEVTVCLEPMLGDEDYRLFWQGETDGDVIEQELGTLNVGKEEEVM